MCRFMASTNQLQEAVFKLFAGGNLVHCAGRAHHAVVNHSHMRAHLLDQSHHMRGNDNRAAGLRIFDQDVFEVGARYRVHGLERLIQHQNAWAVNHRGGQADFLGHAGRIIGDHSVGGLGQIESIQEVFRAASGLLTAHAA